jgi:hypothetical protein
MGIPAKGRTASYVLKIIVIVSAVVGTVLSAAGGRHSFMGGSVVFMYFTIQSNILIALICLIGLALMAAKKRIGKVWYIIKFVGTVAITLTGVVFCFVLAPTMKTAAWNIQNILTHVVVPLASIADFLVIGSGVDVEIRKRSVFFVIIPPLLYAIYAGIGYVKGWQFGFGANYPYFFLNWGSPAGAFGFSDKLPFMGTGWWIVAIFIFLILVGLLYLSIVRGIRRRRAGKTVG